MSDTEQPTPEATETIVATVQLDGLVATVVHKSTAAGKRQFLRIAFMLGTDGNIGNVDLPIGQLLMLREVIDVVVKSSVAIVHIPQEPAGPHG
jgi:hypothetical protein